MIYDFSECLFDLAAVPKNKTVLQHYAELETYTEIKSASDLDVRVAFALSDINSPFLKIRDAAQRIKAVMEWCGCKDREYADKLLGWKHEGVGAIAATYLFMQNNHDFTLWWNMNQLFYALMNEMGKPMKKDEDVDDYVKRKLSIQKQSNGIKADLQKIESELFSDSKMKMAIVKQKLSKTRTYAEMFADDNQVE